LIKSIDDFCAVDFPLGIFQEIPFPVWLCHSGTSYIECYSICNIEWYCINDL